VLLISIGKTPPLPGFRLNMATMDFFRSLDTHFLNYKEQSAVVPIVFESHDFLIKDNFDLPIPVLNGSRTHYSFKTKTGDIAFGVRFASETAVSAGSSEEVVPLARVPSDQEDGVRGSYLATRDGILLLHFSNDFSWFNTKLLSYRVEMFQPAFTVADISRARKARSFLSTIVEDTRKAELRLSVSKHRISQLKIEIPTIEDKLTALLNELTLKKAVLAKATSEAEEMTSRIDANLLKKDGLCIRLLNRQVMVNLLAMLGPHSSVQVVCKYWRACVVPEQQSA